MTSWTDHHSILTTLTHLAYAQDCLDCILLKSLFCQDSTVNLDTSGHPLLYAPQALSVAELVEKMRLALGGFDSTQHVLSNPLVTIQDSGKEANASVVVHAFCFLGSQQEPHCDYVLTRSIWELGLLKEKENWAIKGVVVKRSSLVEGDPNLHAKAHERVTAGKIRASTSALC